jgi:hypothetical protein
MFRFQRLGIFGLLALSLSTPAVYVHAQSSTAAITGTITDSAGASVASAKVTVTNTSTGISTTTVTNSRGFFTFPQIAIGGPYTVDIDATGFKKYESTGLMLNLNDNRSVNAKLDIGSTSQTVEVTATNGAVDTTDTQLKDTISATEIEQFPLFGRDASGLQKLQAGSVESSDRFGTSSADGTQTSGNSFVLDGIDINDGPLQSSGISVNPDALAEETIITSTLNPEFSRNSGAIINQTIKSGTNSFHGSAFELYRDTFLNNGDYFSLPGQRPPFHQNLYGGTLGGPIVKDKLFGFVAYQGYRNKTGTTQTTVVPSALQRTGNFAGDDGVVIPAASLNPIAVRLLNTFVPLPNTVSGGQPAYSFPTANTGASDQGIIRVDYHLSEKDSFFASSTFQSSPTTETLPFDGANLPGFGEVDAAHYKLFSADYTHTFTPNLLNDLQAAYFRFNYAAVEPQKVVLPSSYGFAINPQSPSAGLPNIGVQGAFTLGFTADGPQPRKDTNLRGSDTFTWVKGNHTLKFGGSVEQFRVSNPFFGNNNGNFAFNNDTDQFSGLQDFLKGTADTYTQGSGGFIDALAWENYFYAQDSWKINADFVLNYGLAYDIETPNKNRQDDGLDVGCFQVSNATTNVFKGVNKFPGYLYPGDPGCNAYGGTSVKYNHFAPRIGFDWSPSEGPAFLLGSAGSHNFSIRGGFGIYYNRDQEEGQLQNLSVPPFSLTANVANPDFANPLGVGAGKANPFPFSPPTPGAVIDWSQFIELDTNAISPTYSVPYVYNFNLNVQRELPSNIRLQVGYVGSLGHHLVIATEGDPITAAGHAACVADTTGCGDPSQIFEHLLYPQYAAQPATYPGSGGAPYYLSVGTQGTTGSSNYNSAQVTVSKVPTHGLSFQIAYTYSKALDNGSGLESSGFHSRSYNQYPGFSYLNYGPSDYDARHRLSAGYVYTVPVYHTSNYLLREALSGWQVAGITAVQTGNPVSLSQSGVYLSKWCDAFSYYGCPDNPNTSSFKIKTSNPRGPNNQFFATSSFSSEQLGTFGNTSRGLIHGPGFNYTNLSISKNFPLSSDGVRYIQLRLDAANAFNHANFAAPDANFGDSTFGASTSVVSSADVNGDPQGGRAVQLVGKFYF